MPGNAIANFLLGLLGEIPELARALETECLFHLEDVLALARADQPAAAARRTEADTLGFEQDYVHAGLGQGQGRGKPRESAPDHANVGSQFLVERRPVGDALRRRDVVTVRIARSVRCGHVRSSVGKGQYPRRCPFLSTASRCTFPVFPAPATGASVILLAR